MKIDNRGSVVALAEQAARGMSAAGLRPAEAALRRGGIFLYFAADNASRNRAASIENSFVRLP